MGMEIIPTSTSGRLDLTKLAISKRGNGYAGTYIPMFLEIGSMNNINATPNQTKSM